MGQNLNRCAYGIGALRINGRHAKGRPIAVIGQRNGGSNHQRKRQLGCLLVVILGRPIGHHKDARFLGGDIIHCLLARKVDGDDRAPLRQHTGGGWAKGALLRLNRVEGIERLRAGWGGCPVVRCIVIDFHGIHRNARRGFITDQYRIPGRNRADALLYAQASGNILLPSCIVPLDGWRIGLAGQCAAGVDVHQRHIERMPLFTVIHPVELLVALEGAAPVDLATDRYANARIQSVDEIDCGSDAPR
ncbi:MAG: hypothetical protein LBU48_01420 [Coriobacteriales bacterium]|nr:hypothetical protein [Coriobacteriales bacterium]